MCDGIRNIRAIRVFHLKVLFDESQATWNEPVAGVSWQVAGASGENDFESTDIDSVQILADGAIALEKQLTLSPAKVRELVDGTFTNNRFIIVADSELDDRFNYKSAAAGHWLQRPKLVIQYTLPSSTATPRPSPTPSDTPVPTATFTLTATAPPTPSPVFTHGIFTYDGDGKRVKSVITTDIATTTTCFAGADFEVASGVVTKHYSAGAQRIALGEAAR